MKSYRDFLIWQKSISFVTAIYNVSANFPEQERFGLTSQIRRAAISIPSNFAEGFGRFHNKSFINYIRITIGSLYEVQTQLEISKNIDLITDVDYSRLLSYSNEILSLKKGLIKSLSSDKDSLA